LDAEDVVVDREHVEVGRVVVTSGGLDRNLRVIDAREVARAGRLVLLGLEREGVRVHTGVGGAGVVVVRLDLVEVLTGLLLEAVLAVEYELHGVNGTDSLLSELHRTTVSADLKKGSTGSGSGDERVRRRNRGGVRLEDDLSVVSLGGEVPETLLVIVLREAPYELLDGVVVREADLLGTTRGGNRVNTSVLDLLDQVLVTLLGEAATLLGVKVDVVSPHLESGAISVSGELISEVEVETDLVVLKSDEGERETGVAVEEENQGKEHLRIDRSGHLTPRSLLGLVEVKLGVQTPPLLVVLVDALTTDGKLNILDGTLGGPAGISVRRTGTSLETRLGLELDVHVVDEVTVARNGDRHATGVGGSTVDGLLDVLHREVGVAAVDRLEESNLRVAGQVDILGTVSDELHETTGHCELLYYIPTFFLSREKHGIIFPHHT
jgi:hypothetical protein